MDIVKVKGLEVYCNHGVFPEENKLGQKFIVDIVMYMNTRKAGILDDLESSVNYGTIAHMVTDYMKKNTFKLIEAVAENVAKHLLMNISNIKEVEIEVKKPWAPIGLPVEYASVAIRRGWHTAYIALGSNMGNRQGFLDMAADEVDNDENCMVLKIADSIETKAYGVTDQEDYLNSCMEVRTLYNPEELLELCNKIEAKANRVRTMHWGPRTLDLDIIFYDDLVISKENLIVPHIDMANRDFVLKPLAQIVPYKVHPLLNKRVCELLEELNKKELI